jgi:carbon-monoxide dehydrogenase medium subunit
VVFRIEAMERALSRQFAPEAIAEVEVEAEGLNADLQATAEYRAHLVHIMARRAIARAAAQP